MFYAQFVLLKKGPLARIWLAAHWEKKLTKAQIYDTDIDKAVDYILEPRGIRMALRTSGHLLLGVVKIYSRKTKYLLSDCNDTYARIRLAFRPGVVAVDLPEDHLIAPFEAITVPEVFHDFDSAGMDISLNQGRYEDITMAEVPTSQADEIYNIENAFGFGDEEIEVRRGASSGQFMADDFGNMRNSVSGRKIDGLEGNSGNQIDFGQFLTEDVNMANAEADARENDVRPAFMATSSPTRDANLPQQGSPGADANVDNGKRLSDAFGMTTLLSNPADGFVLPPLDENTILGYSRQHGGKRKRRRCLMVDEKISIDPDVMKEQINNYRDTMRSFEMAPETKRKMFLKERESAAKLLSIPSLSIGSDELLEVFNDNLKMRLETGEPIDIGITLSDTLHPDAHQQFAPLFDDVEMERNLIQSEPPVEIEQAEQRIFNQPLPAIPEEPIETPHGNENEAPLRFLASVMGNSAFMSALPNDQPPEPQREQIFSQRNSSTPVPTPVKSPRKNRSLQEDEFRELNISKSSQASIAWDTQARNIILELKKLGMNGDVDPKIAFSDMATKRDTRKTIARKFYAILQLKKAQAIDVKQDEPYGKIIISTGASFYADEDM